MKYLILSLMLTCSTAGAATFKDIKTPYNEPIYQFMHGSTELFVWVWLQEPEGDISRACIARPYLANSGKYVPFNLMCEYASPTVIENSGGIRSWMINTFLPLANKYLSDNSDDDGEPPFEAENWEKVAWLISNDIYYDDGQLYIR